MRTLTSLGLLALLCAACAKKPAPDIAPEPEVGAEEEVQLPSGPPTLADTGRRHVTLTSDLADPVFAGRKLSEWRSELMPEPAASLQPEKGAKSRTALKVMECYGPHAVAAIPELIRLPLDFAPDPALWKAMGPRAALPLADALTDNKGRYAAGRGLTALGPMAAPAVPKLIELLDHPQAPVRTEAARALGTVGRAAKAAVPKLTALLADKDAGVGYTAAYALARLDPSVDAAIPLLIPAKPGPPPPGLTTGFDPVLVKAYGPRLARALAAAAAPNGRFNYWFISPLHYMGTDAAAAVPQLVQLAKDLPPDDAATVLSVLETMCRTDQPGARDAVRPLVPDLLACAADPSGKKTLNACWVLANFGEAAAPAVPHMIKYLGGGYPTAMHSVFVTLGPVAKDAAPELLRRAKAGGPNEDRSSSLLAAARVGAAPADVLAVAKELAKDPASRVLLPAALEVCGAEGKALRDEVVRDLGARPPDSFGMSRLIHAAPTDPDAARWLLEATSRNRLMATAAARLDYVRKEAVAGFRHHLKHPDPAVAYLAAAAVFRRDPTDAAAAQVLKGDPHPAASGDAAEAFEKAGKVGVPHLLDLLKHPALRPPAAAALARLAADMPIPADALAAALPGSDSHTSYYLLVALGRCGERAKPHLGAVREALKHAGPEARVGACVALNAIDPTDRSAAPVLAEVLKLPPAAQPPNIEVVVKADLKPSLHLPEDPTRGDSVHNQPRYSVRALAAHAMFDADPEAAIRSGAFAHSFEWSAFGRSAFGR